MQTGTIYIILHDVEFYLKFDKSKTDKHKKPLMKYSSEENVKHIFNR